MKRSHLPSPPNPGGNLRSDIQRACTEPGPAHKEALTNPSDGRRSPEPLSRREALLGTVAAFNASPSRSSAAGSDAKAELTQLMRDIMHAWDSLEPAKAATYYAKDPTLVFYDDSPLKYTGWAEYARGVPKEFAAYTSFKTTLSDDVAAHRRGDFAWGTATWRADAVKKNGSTEVVYGRWTVLFEQRGGKWLIIHEHVSVPAA